MKRLSIFVPAIVTIGITVFAVSHLAVAEDKAKDQKKVEWQELFDGKTLKGWEATKYGGEGEVEVKDGQIVMNRGESMTGINWTGKPPKSNFELTLEGMRLEGHDFFCTTTFPVGNEFCSLVVGGWGGVLCGISCIDHYDASDNQTTTFPPLKEKTWHRVRIRVTDAKIESWIDDKQIVNLQREGHKFSLRSEISLSKPLGIATWSTKGAVRNIRLRTLKPDEIPAKP